MLANIQKILVDTARQADLEDEFSNGRYEKYRQRLERLLLSLAKDYPKFPSPKLIRGLVDLLLTLGAAVLGFVTSGPVAGPGAWLSWSIFVVMGLLAYIASRLIPDEPVLIDAQIRRLRLGDLAERLAAQVAIYDQLMIVTGIDDDEAISKLSKYIPALGGTDISSEARDVIRASLDKSLVISDASNTRVKIPILGLDDAQNRRLQDTVIQLNEIGSMLFSGQKFSTKIYLLCKGSLDQKEVRLLVSFARYAPTEEPPTAQGSSWVKVRSNPSVVWRALESGKVAVGNAEDWNVYYKSVLAICLPGRIGVLALTSNDNNAFDNMDSTIVKTLQIATSDLVRKTLNV